MNAKELLQAELMKRMQANKGSREELKGMIDEQRAIAKMDPSFRTDYTPRAAFIDELTGSNLARSMERPESTQQALRKALAYRMQLPNESVSGLPAAIASLEKAAMKDAGGGLRELSARDIMKVQEGENIPMMLDDVEKTIASNVGIFGPIEGRARSMNPYDTNTRAVDAQMRATSQAFGRYMEGGVLRKEDEEKYRKMFPQLSDTPGVAAEKLNVVRRLLQQKQAGDVMALKKGGFDIAPFEGGVAAGQLAPQSSTVASGSFDPSQLSDAELDEYIKKLSQGR